MTKSGPLAGASHHGILRIVSGGQTGVDRAALDVAMRLGIAHGGWCPKGRRAEDGPIDPKYQLTETNSSDYVDRTERNVVNSDGTLLLYRQRLTRGSLLTSQMAKRHTKPILRVRLDRAVSVDRIVGWIADHEIRVLNVAGPRASSSPGIERQVIALLTKLFQATPQLPNPSLGEHP